MELTQSAFNLLLDMTTLQDETAEESQAQDHAAPSQQSREKVTINEPRSSSRAHNRKIYYYDGAQRMSLSKDELLMSIARDHRATHLVWVPHQAEW